MENFDYYLEKYGEIGFVEESVHSLVYVSGLPKVHPNEMVIFEDGDIGQVLGIDSDQAEVLLFSHSKIRVGSKLARTDRYVTISVGDSLLGKTIDPLGRILGRTDTVEGTELRNIESDPPKLMDRKPIEKPLESGVSLVDMVVPLAKGQRQLVIGDRKTGKTEFVLQTIITQARLGTICIYAVIGQKYIDIKKLTTTFAEKNILGSTVVIASSSSDASGLIYLTPYTAMTIAEYFRDKGMDVLLILDDLTTHARTYREISLLGRRFPGRSSYPGDIFYIHARLCERAGNFKKGSITCLPLAESLLGDLSGYIQTNLMAMTDGHIFFDIDLYNQGKRPAVNPFLSVTRVGHQTQTPLLRDTSRELSSFLVTYERMKQFLHFGAEVGETARNILALGSRIDSYFNQGTEKTIPLNINLLILAGLWAGVWSDTKVEDMRLQMERVNLSYSTDPNFKTQVNEILAKSKTFSELVSSLRRNADLIRSKAG